MQLPPKLAFHARVATAVLEQLSDVRVVCEPRNASWFTEHADIVLREHRIARMASDPAGVPDAAQLGGFRGLEYHHLHGSPRMYW